jgi:hypothetical protein
MKLYHGSYIKIDEIDLANASNQLHGKDWTEIYKLLLNELKL